MKRDDFINKLEKALKYKYDNFELDLILDEVEKLGMLPPHRPILIGNPDIKTDEDCANLPALILKDSVSWEPQDNNSPYSMFGIDEAEYKKFLENPGQTKITLEMFQKAIKDAYERLNK